ncbi:MAG: hypothetical protein ACOWWO_16955 [Peptococcaceae bacterium]
MNTLRIEQSCPDAATDKCPCEAAITLDCPVCNVLNHAEKCECSQTWPGICVYENYLQTDQNVSKNTTKDIQVLQKLNLENCVKLICLAPDHLLEQLQQFDVVKLLAKSEGKKLNLTAVLAKIIREKNLVTFIIDDANYEIPLKYGPILAKGMKFDIKVTSKVLPPLEIEKMQKVLVTADGFWLGLVNPILDLLKKQQKEVTLVGPFSRNILSKFNLTQADKVIAVEKITEFPKDSFDTIICLNTPSLQKRLVSSLWKEKLSQTLIAVNNNCF